MKKLHKAILIIVGLVLVTVAWLWWTRPPQAEMEAYVPADTLIYLEVNSLPKVISDLGRNNAWKRLAPAAGLNLGLLQNDWVAWLIAVTGIGPAEAVVLTRAQVGITILGLDAVEVGDALTIKPRLAIIIETHTSEGRVQQAAQRLVGDFARRAYGQPHVEQKTTDNVSWTVWRAPEMSRQIMVAVSDSVAVIGNDEATIEACLATKAGERPAVIGDTNLKAMRRRVDAGGTLAFGYVPPPGAAKLLEVVATAYGTQISSDPRVQSTAAILLPRLAGKVLGGAAWSARIADGHMEDRYFFAVQDDVAQRLQGGLDPAVLNPVAVSELLPAETYGLTRYNYQAPEAAWRALNTAVTMQLDKLSASLITRLLDASLKPYGIESPRDFLRAAGPEIATARLDNTDGSTVLLAMVRDREALRAQVLKHLGANTRAERIGDAEMLVAVSPKREAASFIANYLVMGEETNVRRCLEARRTSRTLATTESFKQSVQHLATTEPIGVVTFTNDASSARAVISSLSTQSFLRTGSRNNAQLEQALTEQPYAVSETRFVVGGFERRTRSAFGQFGRLVVQFDAPEND